VPGDAGPSLLNSLPLSSVLGLQSIDGPTIRPSTPMPKRLEFDNMGEEFGWPGTIEHQELEVTSRS